MNVYDSVAKNNIYIKSYILNKNSNSQFSFKNVSEEESTAFNAPVLATTVAGTLIPMLIIRKYQGKSLKPEVLKGIDLKLKAKAVLKSFNIEYGLKEMLFTSFGSILGGLSGGLLLDKKENSKSKIKEFIFQFSNIAIPTSLVAGLLNLTTKNKKFQGVSFKIASVALGIGAGMPIAAMASNKINNTIIDTDNCGKRKLRLKDCFVHIDDLIGALVLSKMPFVDKLQIDKFLPVLYGVCGYETGIKK